MSTGFPPKQREEPVASCQALARLCCDVEWWLVPTHLIHGPEPEMSHAGTSIEQRLGPSMQLKGQRS